VLASISESMRDSNISIESLIQHGDADDGRTYVVLTTHETQEGQLRAALARLEKLETMVDPPVFIRIAAVSEENN